MRCRMLAFGIGQDGLFEVFDGHPDLVQYQEVVINNGIDQGVGQVASPPLAYAAIGRPQALTDTGEQVDVVFLKGQ